MRLCAGVRILPQLQAPQNRNIILGFQNRNIILPQTLCWCENYWFCRFIGIILLCQMYHIGVRILPQPQERNLLFSVFGCFCVCCVVTLTLCWFDKIYLMSCLYCKWSLEMMDEDQQNRKKMANTMIKINKKSKGNVQHYSYYGSGQKFQHYSQINMT